MVPGIEAKFWRINFQREFDNQWPLDFPLPVAGSGLYFGFELNHAS